MAKTKKGRRGNGEGSILQRKDGTWMGQVTLPESDKRKTVYGKHVRKYQRKLPSCYQRFNLAHILNLVRCHYPYG